MSSLDSSFDQFFHEPVLLTEVMDSLQVQPGMRILDCTLGGGGHSLAFLQRGARVTALDCDEQALEAARQRLGAFTDFRALHVNFGSLGEDDWMQQVGPQDGVLMDLGVSSPQLDQGQRGFSIRRDGPLDMRMDRRLETTAQALLQDSSEAELKRIFSQLGEEPQAGKVARRLVQERAQQDLLRTSQLATVVESVLGRPRPGRVHPATRVFQALRMEVNQELPKLSAGLEAAFELLVPGGRLAVLAYHSLEDRLVKRFIQARLGRCICPRGAPLCSCQPRAQLQARGRAVQASPAEVERNPRSRSVRLRLATKLA